MWLKIQGILALEIFTLIFGLETSFEAIHDKLCISTTMGEKYTGPWATADNGKPCVEWTKLSPGFSDDNFPDGSSTAAFNYCRNPELRGTGPGCYVDNGEGQLSWSPCNIPMCDTWLKQKASNPCPKSELSFWGNVPSVGSSSDCAQLCRSATQFICLSFVYNILTQKCQLSETHPETQNPVDNLSNESCELFIVGDYYALDIKGPIAVHVEKTGSDTPGCGSPQTPCQSVEFGLKYATYGYHIVLHDRGVIHCSDGGILVINSSVHFRSQLLIGRPIITCSVNSTSLSVNRKHGHVTFSQIDMQNTTITISEFHIGIKDSYGEGVTFDSPQKCSMAGIDLVDFVQRQYISSLGSVKGKLFLTCDNITLNLFRGRMEDFVVGVWSREQLRVVFDYLDFTYTSTNILNRTLSALQLIVGRGLNVISVTSSKFYNIFPKLSERFQAGVASSAVFMIGPNGRFKNSDLNQTNYLTVMLFENVTIHNSTRGIRMEVFGKDRVLITNSLFSKCQSFGDGAALEVLPFIETRLTDENLELLDDVNASVRIMDSNFTENLATAFGSVIPGRGGAIYCDHYGELGIFRSYFIDNSAQTGGHIYAHGNIFVALKECEFVFTSDIDKEPARVDQITLYTSGVISDVTIRTDYVESGTPIFYFSRGPARQYQSITSSSTQLLFFLSLSTLCPVGYDIRVAFIETIFHSLSEMVITCIACTGESFSTDHGRADFKQAVFLGSYGELQTDIKHINCSICPFGGRCVEGQVIARPGFFGIVQALNITFYECAPGFTCQTEEECDSYNTCSANREGLCCGSCAPGFSESLGSPSCEPDTDCDQYWALLVSLALALLFALYLMYKSALLTDCVHLIHTIRKKCCKQTPVETSNLKSSNMTFVNKASTVQDNVSDDDSDVRSDKDDGSTTITVSINQDNNQDATGATSSKAEDEDEKRSSTTSNGSERNPSTDIIRHPQGRTSSNTGKPNSIQSLNSQKTNSRNRQSLYPPPLSLSQGQTSSEHSQQINQGDKAYIDRGYIGILMYYFQIASLIQVDIAVSHSSDRALYEKIVEILVGVFNFDLVSLDLGFCIKGITAYWKIMLAPYFVLLMYASLGIIYFIISLFKRCRNNRSSKHASNSCNGTAVCDAYTCVVTGFVETIKYTYEVMAVAAFQFLTCQKIGDKTLWFYDTSFECLTTWQSAIIVYIVIFVVPFSLAFGVGFILLKKEHITSLEFFLACFLPLPMLIYWAIRACLKKRDITLTDTGRIIIDVVHGPFRYTDDDQTSSNSVVGLIRQQTDYWEAIIETRRLLLTVLVLVIEDIYRTVTSVLLCVVFLVHHIKVQPFVLSRSNLAESGSLLCLLLIALSSLVKVVIKSLGVPPTGPIASTLYGLDFMESVVLVMIPVGILLLEIFSCIIHKCAKNKLKTK